MCDGEAHVSCVKLNATILQRIFFNVPSSTDLRMKAGMCQQNQTKLENILTCEHMVPH